MNDYRQAITDINNLNGELLKKYTNKYNDLYQLCTYFGGSMDKNLVKELTTIREIKEDLERVKGFIFIISIELALK